MKRKHKSVFISTAQNFEEMAAALGKVAAKEKNLRSKAAMMREAAHYLECAVRLRSTVKIGEQS